MVTEDIKYAIKKLKIEDIDGISKIGEGAWHSVYRIKRKMEADIVIRIKKEKAYGQLQEFNELDLKTEYESSKAYYELANQCSVNICPSFFSYFLDESIVFTVESFMGEGKRIQDLTNLEAYTLGKKLGYFFRDMHGKEPGIKGFGNLLWNGKQLEGSLKQDIAHIWQSDNNYYENVMYKLIGTDLELFNKDIIVEKILTIIKKRRGNQQSIALVNQDITPENIIFGCHNVALIDPFPKLDFNLKYAGYFVFCYKFLLMAYSNAPRYQKYHYKDHYEALSKMADGFIYGYIDVNEYLYKQIMDEYILWTLLETYENYEMLHKEELSYKTLLQMGDKDMINQRLEMCLEQLVKLCKTN
ncbi:hypothetical protein [Pradoshia sp.]